MFTLKLKLAQRSPSAPERTIKKKETESMDKVDQYQELEEELEEVEVESKDLPQEEVEHRKEGVVKRFFNFFKPEKDDGEEESEAMEAGTPESIDDDVKEVLKISLKWIEHLPRHKLKEFRESEDFQKYKEVLIKHGLAKESGK